MTLPCVILAGGEGRRMRPLTASRPKALVPVAGKPFAHHQLAWLASVGITRVVYCVGYLGEQLRAEVGDGSAWGLEVDWVEDGETLRGTGGALRHALEEGVLGEACFVLYGDSYLPLDVRPVEAAFTKSGMPALMTVLRNEGKWGPSNAIVEGDRVTLYDKVTRSAAMQHIDYGLLAFTRDAIATRIPRGETVDLATTLRALSVDGELAAFEVRERFYEVGSTAGLADLEAFLEQRR